MIYVELHLWLWMKVIDRLTCCRPLGPSIWGPSSIPLQKLPSDSNQPTSTSTTLARNAKTTCSLPVITSAAILARAASFVNSNCNPTTFFLVPWVTIWTIGLLGVMNQQGKLPRSIVKADGTETTWKTTDGIASLLDKELLAPSKSSTRYVFVVSCASCLSPSYSMCITWCLERWSLSLPIPLCRLLSHAWSSKLDWSALKW